MDFQARLLVSAGEDTNIMPCETAKTPLANVAAATLSCNYLSSSGVILPQQFVLPADEPKSKSRFF
jgi:hypothetical protein